MNDRFEEFHHAPVRATSRYLPTARVGADIYSTNASPCRVNEDRPCACGTSKTVLRGVMSSFRSIPGTTVIILGPGARASWPLLSKYFVCIDIGSLACS